MYRIATLDIDGTLVDSYGNLSKRTKNTIIKLQNQGVFVTLCTGRNVHNTLPIAKQLNIKLPLICIDGIYIYDAVNKNVICEHLINNDELRTIVDIAKTKDAYIELVTSHNYYKFVKNINLRSFDFVKNFAVFERFLNYRRGIRYIQDFTEAFYNKLNCHVAIIGAKQPLLDRIKAELSNLRYDHLILEDTLWKDYIFVHHCETNKGYGIKLLCRRLNLDLKDVVGIGDDYNDIAMFKVVGMPVAMGNAVSYVKQFAKDITKTINEDGAALALEKYFNI